MFTKTNALYGLLCMAMLSMIPSESFAFLNGANITYECLGGCTYRVYITQYNWCALGVPPGTPPVLPQNFRITANGGCTAPIPIGGWQMESYRGLPFVFLPENTAGCNPPGISDLEETVFYRDYDFCNVNCNSYTARWSPGSPIPSSVSGADLYAEVEINLGLAACNSSPRFYSPPKFVTTNSFNIEAFDPDGDSLVYSYVPCKVDSVNNLTYHPLNGDFPATPLGGHYTHNLNSQTGEMTIDFAYDPAFFGILQEFVCVEVAEFRNGVQIGSVRQDFIVYVTNTPLQSVYPKVDSIYGVSGGNKVDSRTLEGCTGKPMSFSLSLSDLTPSNQLILATNVDRVFPGAAITQSGISPVVATVSFTPSRDGVFGFHLTAHDSTYAHSNYFNVKVVVGGACLSATITDAPCGANTGAIDLMLGAIPPPHTFLWSNGDTTGDISGLSPGTYSVVVTDSSGTTYADTFLVNASSIDLNAVLVLPTCLSRFGDISLTPTGGAAPYSFLWSNGDTTAAISGVSPGSYTVTATDSTGCFRQEVIDLPAPDSCFNTIEGYVYNDMNQNCVQDAGENGLPFVYVDLEPGGSAYTDQNGYYSFQADSGLNKVTAFSSGFSAPFCPGSGMDSVNFVGFMNDTAFNFAYTFVQVQDLRVNLNGGLARPGRMKTSYIQVQNVGSIPITPTLTWTHDTLFTFNSANPPATAYDPVTRTATWNLAGMAPGSYALFNISLTGDTSLVPGASWQETASVTPVVGDSTPANNTDIYVSTVRASYDPNDKQVTPQGIRAPGYILASENEMEYLIRFQNTGTDTAFLVVLRDTLDTDLDVSSFVPLTQSFPYTLTVENDEVLVFTFSTINLPDSTTDLNGSQGHVSFKLNHAGTLAAGTVIENSAAIYFDFNAPVITNTVTNTIYTQPVVGLGNDTTICLDQFLEGNILEAGMPPYDFTWSTGDTDPGNVSGTSQTVVTASGSYAVSVTDAFGFTTNDTIMVTAAPLPDAAFGLTQTNLNITLDNTSTDNTDWEWDFGDGNTDSGLPMTSHTYSANGTYTVTLVATNDCGSDTSSQMIHFTVGLDVNENGMFVSIRPNPFSTSARVDFENPSRREISIYLYDLQGRQVREYQTTGEQVEVLRGNLPGGMYLLEVRGEAVHYGRVVVD